MLDREKVSARVNVKVKAMSLPYAAPEILLHWKNAAESENKITTVVDLTTQRSRRADANSNV